MKSCPQSPGLGSEEGSSTETNPKIPPHIDILPLPEESTSSNAAQPENRAQEHPHAMGGRRILQDFWAVWNPELPLSPSVAPLLGPFVPCWACFQSQIPWETWSYRTQENSRGTPSGFQLLMWLRVFLVFLQVYGTGSVGNDITSLTNFSFVVLINCKYCPLLGSTV